MRVEIGDHTYFVLFHTTNHGFPGLELKARYKHSHGTLKGLNKYLLVSHTTNCQIKFAATHLNKTSKEAELIVSTEAYCSVKDKFDLHEGRRNALKLALVKLEEWDYNRFSDAMEKDLPKPIRIHTKLFWEAFVKTVPKRPPTVKQLKRVINQLHKRINDLTVLADSVAMDMKNHFSKIP